MLGFELLRIAFFQHQPIVVIQFLTGRNVAQSLDENAPVHLISFAIAVARMVDPARRVATHLGVNHVGCINVKVKRVVGVLRVVRMACLGFFPGNDLPNVLDDGLALSDILQRKHTLAMDAGATGLNLAVVATGHGFAHGCSFLSGRQESGLEKFGMVNRMGVRVRAHVCVCACAHARNGL